MNDGEIRGEPERPRRDVRSGEVVPGTKGSRASSPKRGGTNASGFERTVGIIRAAVPLVQKVLPLLDGNVALAVANLLAPRLQPRPVDLHPVETSIAQLREEMAGLGQGAAKQEAMLRRVENEVESVKDALERSAASQTELKADLERLRIRITGMAVVGFLLLAASIAANVVLLVRMERLLR